MVLTEFNVELVSPLSEEVRGTLPAVLSIDVLLVELWEPLVFLEVTSVVGIVMEEVKDSIPEDKSKVEVSFTDVEESTEFALELVDSVDEGILKTILETLTVV